ncbi:MAG: hypothetical protein H0T51_22950, partial [Pirellulales bacterium]|nr:hypothetical protein [Pirellulales bacterium]
MTTPVRALSTEQSTTSAPVVATGAAEKAPRRSRLSQGFRQSMTPWLVPLAGLAVWQAASALGLLPARLIPSPLEVTRAAVRLTASGELPRNVAISARRAVVGFLLGGGLGLALGMLNGLSNRCERLFDTTIQMARAVPHLALVPLIILWLGIGETAKVSL